MAKHARLTDEHMIVLGWIKDHACSDVDDIAVALGVPVIVVEVV